LNRVIDLRQTPPEGHAAARREKARTQNTRRELKSHAFAFITVVNNEAQYAACVRHIDALQVPLGYSAEKIAIFGAASMAEGYQRGMEASTAQYKIYLHQDLYLVHRSLLSELLHLFRTYPRLGLVGVEGATRLPAAVLYSVNNPFHSYGQHWTYRRPGGLSSLLGPANRRRMHFNRFRSFIGDYLPAVVVDGFFMATQCDMSWTSPLGGFELYDKVRAIEFINAGLEVGIARQQMTWCLHWGPPGEPTRQQRMRRQDDLQRKVAAFRQLYGGYIGVQAGKLYELRRGTAGELGKDPAGEHLGVVIVAINGRERLLRSLRALLPQCEGLKEVEYKAVVVDSASDSTVEAVRQEFPQVTVVANPPSGGLAGAFNVGLRELSFPSYVLVTRDDAELTAGALARMVGYLREHPATAGVVPSLIDSDGGVHVQRKAVVGTACSLIRGEVFFDVGLYDERFSTCNEELDWSIRAKRKGYTFDYLPEARVLHDRRGQLRQEESAGFAERAAADLWLKYKHAGRRRAVALYWRQRMQARWLAFRWRQDKDAVRKIREAMAQTQGLYQKFCEENRRPQLL